MSPLFLSVALQSAADLVDREGPRLSSSLRRRADRVDPRNQDLEPPRRFEGDEPS